MLKHPKCVILIAFLMTLRERKKEERVCRKRMIQKERERERERERGERERERERERESACMCVENNLRSMVGLKSWFIFL